MSRSPSPRRIAVGALAAALLAAAPVAAQGPGAAEVRDLRLPILDLELPESSLDGSVSRSGDREETRITLAADVLFRFGRADLSDRARARLAEVASDVRRADPERVTIVGHTDSRGGEAYNQRLSTRRADAVRRELARDLDGGPALSASGRGEDDPVAANETEDGADSPRGRSRNRRVEIRIPRG